MKKYIGLPALFLLLLASCSSNSNDGAADNSELQLGVQTSDSIGTEAEVDWFHFRAVEANRVLNIRCTSNTYRPDVDLMVTAYEEDESGNRVRIYGDHAMEDSQLPADISMNIYIDTPKDIYLAVRDLMDDEFSDNPYYLYLDYTDTEGANNNFEDAVPLSVDNSEGCQTDEIGSIGDLDFFSFTVSENNAYDIAIGFNVYQGGSAVALTFDLYNSSGDRLYSLNQAQSSSYHIIPYLTAGDYFLQIDDDGRNDFDMSSTYEVCVNSVDTNEAFGNDSRENAASFSLENALSGSLDYWQDEDWYSFDPGAAGADFQVISLDFSGTADHNFLYQIAIVDQDGTLLSHDYHGSSGNYLSQVQAGSGTHYLRVSPAEGQILNESASYEVTLEVTAINDPDEIPGDDANDNDSINNPIILSENVAHQGKIAFRGDIDYYAVEVPVSAEPQVLEVFFNETSPSTVEYAVSLIKDEVVSKVYDLDGSDGASLAVSILVPASETVETYWIKVADYQNDDGADAEYSLSVDVEQIPAAGVVGTIYYSEVAEQNGSTAPASIELVYNALTYSSFRVNTTYLDATNESAAAALLAGGTYTFPTISGYIDFQGDQDWFAIPNQPLDPAHTDWYYDVQVRLQVGVGSQVEYVWRYYPDRPDSNGGQNSSVMERYNDGDGFIASAGDVTLTTEAVDQTVPGPGDEDFWVGDPWQGRAYISVSDFNVVVDNLLPDDDWTSIYPYQLTVSLTYHAGCSYPSESQCGN